MLEDEWGQDLDSKGHLNGGPEIEQDEVEKPNLDVTVVSDCWQQEEDCELDRAEPSLPREYNNLEHHVERVRPMVIVAGDGGCRMNERVASSGFVIYNQQWEVLDAAAIVRGGDATSQDCEFEAACLGIMKTLQRFPGVDILYITDSTFVEQSVLGSYRPTKRSHWLLKQKIQSLQGTNGAVICVAQVPRKFNAGADRLCNWSMDSRQSLQFDTIDPILLCELHNDGDVTSGIVDNVILPRLGPWSELRKILYKQRFDMVLQELLFKVNFLPYNNLCEAQPPYIATGCVNTPARDVPTGFETQQGPVVVDGKERKFSEEVYLGIKQECERLGVHWDDNAFTQQLNNIDEPNPVDIRILSELGLKLECNMEQLVKLVRGETEDDPRPNKHLDSNRYRANIPDYPELEQMCAIADHGFTPRVEGFQPPRPLAENYTSAADRAPAMIKRFTKEYLTGRTLLIDESIAERDSRVHTSPFAVVPKKNVDYEFDGRIIHDLSAPKGNSVNSHVVGGKLDASTDSYISLGERALECYRLYPGIPILGVTADVDSAFQNIPTSAAGSLLMGGRVPGTRANGIRLLALALTGLFGFCDCPGLFGIFARAAKYYIKQGRSDIAEVIATFHSWLWVDDFIGIEPHVGDRLFQAEHRLRTSFHLVFGSPGWNDEKFATWNSTMHAVGLDWDLGTGVVSMPHEKVTKALDKVSAAATTLSKPEASVTLTEWRSLVGSLRHVATCIPAARVFFQSFVRVERQLANKQAVIWEPVQQDLQWFKHVLNHEPLNGIPMESFCSISKTEDWVYLGWNRGQSFLVDFSLGISFLSTQSGPLGALRLIEWYLLTFKLVPNAMGPRTRQPLMIRLMCQTNEFARRIRNWNYHDYSLRTLGWHCTQQHVQLLTSGPSTIPSLSLSCINSLLISEQGPAVRFPTNFVMPWVPELGDCKRDELSILPKQLMIVNWSRGSNFVQMPNSMLIPCIYNQTMFKTKHSCYSLPTAVLEAMVDVECARNLFPKFDFLQCKISPKPGILHGCFQRECVWKWLSLGTNVVSPPKNQQNCPLIQGCYVPSAFDCYPVEPHGPYFVGGVLRCNSSSSVAQGSSGGQYQRPGMPTTSLYGPMSGMVMGRNTNPKQTNKPNGWKYISNRPKGTGPEKEQPSEHIRQGTFYCAQSMPSNESSMPEKSWEFYHNQPTFQIQDVNLSGGMWCPEFSRKKLENYKWMQEDWDYTRLGSEEPRSFLQQGIPILCSN